MPKNLLIAASLPSTPERCSICTWIRRSMGPSRVVPSRSSRVPVRTFRAFEGSLSGTILHVEPKRMIVQTWRSVNWSHEDIDSVLVLSFWPEEGGGRIELAPHQRR